MGNGETMVITEGMGGRNSSKRTEMLGGGKWESFMSLEVALREDTRWLFKVDLRVGGLGGRRFGHEF